MGRRGVVHAVRALILMRLWVSTPCPAQIRVPSPKSSGLGLSGVGLTDLNPEGAHWATVRAKPVQVIAPAIAAGKIPV